MCLRTEYMVAIYLHSRIFRVHVHFLSLIPSPRLHKFSTKILSRSKTAYDESKSRFKSYLKANHPQVLANPRSSILVPTITQTTETCGSTTSSLSWDRPSRCLPVPVRLKQAYQQLQHHPALPNQSKSRLQCAF